MEDMGITVFSSGVLETGVPYCMPAIFTGRISYLAKHGKLVPGILHDELCTLHDIRNVTGKNMHGHFPAWARRCKNADFSPGICHVPIHAH
jgi:hypothetical protein